VQESEESRGLVLMKEKPSIFRLDVFENFQSLGSSIKIIIMNSLISRKHKNLSQFIDQIL
jgi:hypothetical protein